MIMATFGMRLGRRQNIIIRKVISVIGTIISATSYGPGQIIASRVVIISLEECLASYHLNMFRVLVMVS